MTETKTAPKFPTVVKDGEALLGLGETALYGKYQEALAIDAGGFNVTGASEKDVQAISERTGWIPYTDAEGLMFLKKPSKK